MTALTEDILQGLTKENKSINAISYVLIQLSGHSPKTVFPKRVGESVVLY